MRLANSSHVDAVRRVIQGALPRGAQPSLAGISGRSIKAIQAQIEGNNALSLDVFLAALVSLPESDRLRVAREALAPASIVPAMLRHGHLLPAIGPAVASTFPALGRLMEVTALAEADGTVTEEEAEGIRDEAGKATALLESIVTTADVAAGRRLA